MANKPAVAVKTVIATAVEAIGFTAEQVTQLHGFASLFAKSELGILESVAAVKAMITPWNYSQFECARIHWVTGYIAATQCTRDTGDRAFGRFSSDWEDKPKSEAPKAVKNAAARLANDKAVKALIKKHQSSTALRKAAAKALGAGQQAQAELLVKAGKTASREELAASVKALNPRWLAVGEKVSEAKKTADIRILEGLEKYLAVTVPTKTLPRAKKAAA